MGEAKSLRGSPLEQSGVVVRCVELCPAISRVKVCGDRKPVANPETATATATLLRVSVCAIGEMEKRHTKVNKSNRPMFIRFFLRKAESFALGLFIGNVVSETAYLPLSLHFPNVHDSLPAPTVFSLGLGFSSTNVVLAWTNAESSSNTGAPNVCDLMS